MRWNWQQPDWPTFTWSAARLQRAEQRFIHQAGVLVGAVAHLEDDQRQRLTVELMSQEAVTSSEIEGEILDRASVQSSIQRQLGLAADQHRARPDEEGMAELMVDLFGRARDPLDESTLFDWHAWIMRGRRDLRSVGRYRAHPEPMQVVSGKMYDPTVHFEAPPSKRVPKEMRAFIDWFNRTAPEGEHPLPPVTRAGIAHLYFESIHPFEDGNGRIGRALSEKALAQGQEQPTLTALAATILERKRAYYDRLEANNKHLAIDDWTAWFAGITLEAQQRAQASVRFLLDKTRLLQRFDEALNPRQRKVLHRMLREGPAGFRGGLSAGNYASIARTSPATATRDLAEMVDLGLLERTGERRHTRYHLTIPTRPVPTITIDEDGAIVESAAGD